MNLHKCLGDICARARVDTIQFMQTIIDLEARRARDSWPRTAARATTSIAV